MGIVEADGPGALTTRQLARRAGTSPPALYEFFGDKEGMLSAVVFEGFAILRAELESLPATEGARAEIVTICRAIEGFSRRRPALMELMFAHRVEDLPPDADGLAAAASVRRALVGAAARGVRTGELVGRPVDIAHNLLALMMGLAAQERAGWLGTTAASRRRRWRAGLDAMLDGFAPASEGRAS